MGGRTARTHALHMLNLLPKVMTVMICERQMKIEEVIVGVDIIIMFGKGHQFGACGELTLHSK